MTKGGAWRVLTIVLVVLAGVAGLVAVRVRAVTEHQWGAMQARIEDLKDVTQTLDLWSGMLDSRFTYEGLSFSWRLKTDVHNAAGHQLYIRDSVIVNPNAPASRAVNWSAWRKPSYWSSRPCMIH